ncbi:MAG: hypothetical protein JJ891_14830 [Rhizobiaceae bacterium]|jgi:hypothetical protein|nr:hypothetical protein [Rhizobiaceae bacterium]
MKKRNDYIFIAAIVTFLASAALSMYMQNTEAEANQMRQTIAAPCSAQSWPDLSQRCIEGADKAEVRQVSLYD